MDRDRFERKMDRWESRMNRRSSRSGTGGVLVGGLIVVVGLLLLLDNMGFIRTHDIWKFWPLWLVAVGLGRIMDSHRPSAFLFGGLLTAVGALLILENLNLLTFDLQLLWPLIIVAFGGAMLLRALDRGRTVAGAPVDSDPTANLFAVFGQVKRKIDSADFRGGEATAIFGGIELDLRGAQIPAGRAVMEVNSMFGGCEIRVPDGWRINLQGHGIFGSFEDKTVPPRPVDGTLAPEFVLTGSAIFGSMEVRN